MFFCSNFCLAIPVQYEDEDGILIYLKMIMIIKSYFLVTPAEEFARQLGRYVAVALYGG